MCLFGSVVNTFQVSNGLGQSVEEFSPLQLLQSSKWTVIAVFETTVATCLIKLSICLFILRVLGPTNRHWRRLICGLLSFLVIITLAFLTVLLLQCRPLNAAWDYQVEGRCYSQHVQLSVKYALGGSFFCYTKE